MGTDVGFNVYSDSRGRDPDSHSPTLRRFHRELWSKPLPNGQAFDLSTDRPGHYLHHRSHLGEFSLSSDSIAHTYRYPNFDSSGGILILIERLAYVETMD